MNIVSVWSDQSYNQSSYWKVAPMQLYAASDALMFGVISFHVEDWFGTENGAFIGDWISINLFTFGPSVGWKPVRKYASY